MKRAAVVGAVFLTAFASACSPASERDETSAALDTMTATLEPGPITPPGDTLNMSPTIETVIVDTAGTEIGTLTLTQDGDSVNVTVRAGGLSDGLHGIHFHGESRCDPPDFASAGGHFNPTGRQHGLENPRGPHAGDLPNLRVTGGRVDTTLTTALATLTSGPTSLLEPDGSALIIHAGPDDMKSDPAGNSGARIACALIRRGT